MRILARLFGCQSAHRNDSQPRRRSTPHPLSGTVERTATVLLTDDEAIELIGNRLRIGPRNVIDPSDLEALKQLNPEQRRHVFQGLSRERGRLLFRELLRDLPSHDWVDRDTRQSIHLSVRHTKPRTPISLESTFGRMNPAGICGLNGFMAGSILSSIANVVFGPTVADAMFNDGSQSGGDQYYAGSADAKRHRPGES